MEKPAVSIVMSVYNASPYLKECMDSILSQTFQDFELIIIDDGSTDNSAEIIQSYKDVRIIFRTSKHDYINSLNMGINMARGKYVARMDADDIMFPDRLEKEFVFMEQHPDIDVCGSDVKIIGKSGYSLPVLANHKDIAACMVIQCPLFHPTVMMRMEKIHKVFGGNNMCQLYDPEYKYAEDYALWAKLLKHQFIFANIEEKLVCYRLSDTQITSVHAKEMKKVGDKVRINMAEYVGEILGQCNSEKIRKYYAETLQVVNQGYIERSTLLRILSNMYHR